MARDDIGGSCWCQGGDFWNPCQGASACTSAVPIENKRLGRRSKAKYFSQEMARRRVVSNGWTQNRARWSSVIIQLVKNAMRCPPTKNKFHCIEHQLFAENAQVSCCQFPWSPEDPIQFAKSCAKLFQTRINSLGPFIAICQNMRNFFSNLGSMSQYGGFPTIYAEKVTTFSSTKNCHICQFYMSFISWWITCAGNWSFSEVLGSFQSMGKIF